MVGQRPVTFQHDASAPTLKHRDEPRELNRIAQPLFVVQQNRFALERRSVPARRDEFSRGQHSQIGPPFVVLPTAGELAGQQIRIGQVQMGGCEIRILLNRPVRMGQRFVPLAGLPQGGCQVGYAASANCGASRTASRKLAIAFVQAALARAGPRPGCCKHRPTAASIARLAGNSRDRLVVAALQSQHIAEIEVTVGQVGIQSARPVRTALGPR